MLIRTMTIKRIAPVSAAKIAGTLYAITGLFIGILTSLASLIGASLFNGTSFAGFGSVIGIGAVIVFPLFYGALGFVTTLAGAWMYNVLAGMVGGVQVEVI